MPKANASDYGSIGDLLPLLPPPTSPPPLLLKRRAGCLWSPRDGRVAAAAHPEDVALSPANASTTHGDELVERQRLSIGKDDLAELVLVPVGDELRASGSSCDGNSGGGVHGGRRPVSGREKLVVFALALSNFSSLLAFATIAPFFPKEAELMDASPTVVGLIFGVFQLTIFLTSPLYGFLIVKTGPRFMLLCGLFISCVCIVLFGLLDRSPPGRTFITLCFLCRIVDANGTAMLMIASFAVMAQQFPHHFGMVMGIVEASIALGTMMGPPIGGLLYEFGGYQLPFYTVGGVLFGTLLLAFYCIPSIESRGEARNFCLLLKIHDALLAFFEVFVANLQVNFTDPILATHLLTIDPTLNAASIGGIFLVGSGVYALLAPLVGYVCDKRKEKLKHIIFTGWVIGTLGLLALGPLPVAPFLPKSLWLLIVSMAFSDAGVVCCWLPSYQLALGAAVKNGYPDNLETYCMVGGLMGAGGALGAFVGPSVGGYLTDRVGFAWTATCCAAIALLMAAATGLSATWLALKKYVKKKNLTAIDVGELDLLILRGDKLRIEIRPQHQVSAR